MVDASEVEKRTDIVKARSVEIGTTLGGLKIMTGKDLEDMAARIARGGIAVPSHCRDQPGVVHTLMLKALEWGMPFLSVIESSYVPRGSDRIGFQSNIIHAVVEKNARLKKRMRYEIGHLVDDKWVKGGEKDDQRRCKVWATFDGEDEPHTYESQMLADMHPGHVTKDGIKYVKGSQLWDDDPEVQMFYAASRQWARLFCPDVLLGAYTPEELERAMPIKDVTPVADFSKRLEEAKQARKGTNFDATKVNSIIEGSINSDADKTEAEDDGRDQRPELDLQGRSDSDADREADHRDEGGSPEAVGSDQAVGEQPVGQEAARPAQGSGEASGAGSQAPRKAKGKRK